MFHQRSFPLYVVCMAMLLFLACHTARMLVPGDLAKVAEEMKVEGRQRFTLKESFTFGPYNVKNVHRGWTKATTIGFFGFSETKAKQSFEFTLQPAEGESWQGKCATGVNREDLKIKDFLGGTLDWGISNEITFLANLLQEGAKQPWRLVMSDLGSSKKPQFKGILTDGEQKFAVESTHRFQGSPIPSSDPIGFLISVDGEVITAVEVINKGAVWMQPSLSGALRDALAAAAAALLLYDDISERVAP